MRRDVADRIPLCTFRVTADRIHDTS